MFFFYVLKSRKDKKLYIGVSADPQKRLLQHNSGKSKSTKYRTPFDLIYKEQYKSQKEAYKREWSVKNTKEGRTDLLKCLQ